VARGTVEGAEGDSSDDEDGEGFKVIAPNAILPGGGKMPTKFGGVIALRALSETTCEIKRMYVSESHRGRNIGACLIKAALKHAAAQGYMQVKLDTIERLTHAIQLYERMGFKRCVNKYCEVPMDDHVCYELDLTFENATG
jgi:GNAT superfamily N-acetyltransferase